MHPFTSTHLAFAFIPAGTIVAGPHYVFALESYGWFAALQNRVHELWVRFHASSMEDRLRYAPSDSFETFPFPQNRDTNQAIESLGHQYYEFRGQLMCKNNEGLTTTYNRFHDPEIDVSEVAKLRSLHDLMDRTVLNAYGWTDIQPKCDFFPEFDEEEEEDDNGRPKKKKYRYRWPDETRDEVLARLLELNRQLALEEGQLLSAAADGGQPIDGKKNKSIKKKTSDETEQPTPGLFTADKGDA